MAAASGDVIYLDDGTYDGTGDYTYIKDGKSLTIRAKDGKSPVVQLTCPVRILNASTVKFIGIKFDGTSLGLYDSFFYAADATNNSMEFEDCEFTNMGKNIFQVASGKKLSNLTIKDCDLHDNSNRGILNQGTIETIDIKSTTFTDFTGSGYSPIENYGSGTIGTLKLDDCEFSGCAGVVIEGHSGTHLGFCNINNCYFHGNSKNTIIFDKSSVESQETCDKLFFKNSTIANSTKLTNWTSTIDIQPYSTSSNSIKVEVDHCTFYNNETVDNSKGAIRAYYINDVTITNCIFAHSESIDQPATSCYGGSISNCLTYNLTTYSSQNGHRQSGGVPTLTDNFTADPLFTNVATGYRYDGDWTATPIAISPARGAGTDGSDLGDPRWYSSETLPSTDFASSYALSGSNAQLKGNIGYDSENDRILYSDSYQTKGTATWKVHATGACNVTASYRSEYDSGRKLQIEIHDAENNTIGSVQESSTTHGTGDKTIPGIIAIPSAGDYTLVLTNSTEWSAVQVSNLALNHYPVVSVVGQEVLTGVDWDASDETNDMTYDAESGKFVWTKEKFYHDGRSSDYEFKIAKDRVLAFPDPDSWHITSSYFASGAGYYNLKIEYTPSPEAASVTTTYLYPKVEIKGGFNSWTYKELEDYSEGVLSTTIKMTADDYSAGNGFKVHYNEEAKQWGYYGMITRTDCTNRDMNSENDNCGLVADVDGDYVFSFIVSTGKWTVTYPMTFSREVTNTDYGTICLPCAAVLSGATAYSVDPTHIAEGYVTLVEVGTNLVAGVPYIIKPAAAGEITATMSDDAVASPVNNYLYGVWGATVTKNASDEVYALKDNKLTRLTGTAQVRVASTRAYFKTTSASAPSIIRIVDGEEIVTDIKDVEDQEQTVKFIQNGKLFIQKNGVVYDMLGTVVR